MAFFLLKHIVCVAEGCNFAVVRKFSHIIFMENSNVTANMISKPTRKTIVCPKCGRQTSFYIPSDAIDLEGEFYRCQHCNWVFHYMSQP